MQIGLIAEGASELRILKHIVGRYLGTEHDLNEIQPKTDNEGKQIGGGGWDRVIQTFEYENTVRDALVENDYVVIQIDTDYADTAPFSVEKIDENGQCCSSEILHQRVLERILSKIPNIKEEDKQRVLLAICINEIECWLLPIYYNNDKKCKTTQCINLLNTELRKHDIHVITEKNTFTARNTYNTILKSLKKPKDIENISQYQFGFNFFVQQMKKIKESLKEE